MIKRQINCHLISQGELAGAQCAAAFCGNEFVDPDEILEFCTVLMGKHHMAGGQWESVCQNVERKLRSKKRVAPSVKMKMINNQSKKKKRSQSKKIPRK